MLWPICEHEIWPLHSMTSSSQSPPTLRIWIFCQLSIPSDDQFFCCHPVAPGHRFLDTSSFDSENALLCHQQVERTLIHCKQFAFLSKHRHRHCRPSLKLDTSEWKWTQSGKINFCSRQWSVLFLHCYLSFAMCWLLTARRNACAGFSKPNDYVKPKQKLSMTFS